MNYLDFLSAVQELYQRTMAPVSRKYGLTSMELTILLFLANNPECGTAADIIRKRHLTKSHVSTSVPSLEEKGLLRREFHDKDRRAIRLAIARPAGEIVSEGQAAQRHFLSRLSGGLSEKQKADLASCYEQMNLNVFRALEEM